MIFVVVPFLLILFLGKGWKELYEAATLEEYKPLAIEKIKARWQLFSEEFISRKVSKYKHPSVPNRMIYVTQTFITFLPGLSWIPLPNKVAMSRESYAQTLLKRKMFELFGENAPQFILQLAIVLKDHETPHSFLRDGKTITSVNDELITWTNLPIRQVI